MMYETPKVTRRTEFQNMNNLISKSKKVEIVHELLDFVEIDLYSYNGIKFLVRWEYGGTDEMADRTIISDKPIIEFE